MAGATFRDRERLILLSGAAAAAFLALVLLAGIAGFSPGTFWSRVSSSLVIVYICARLWGHGKTLEERDNGSILAPIGQIGAMCILPVLLLQTWATSGIGVNASFADPVPHVRVGLWTRVEWSADVLVIGLFLATAMAVWIEGSTGFSSLLSRAAYVCVGFVTVDLLGCVWGVVSIAPQWRLVAALIVLSLAGTILVATMRRVERLDASPAAPPPDTPEPGAA
ncbi:MAG TPA: hypothetical protein VMT74_13725 [Gaiellaceae bacterium]|nr:hypothetical protein [Gaiellaceae bacterium]